MAVEKKGWEAIQVKKPTVMKEVKEEVIWEGKMEGLVVVSKMEAKAD